MTFASAPIAAGDQADLGEFQAAQQIQHFHDLLVLHGGVAAHDDREVGLSAFGAQPVLQLGQGDGIGVQEDLAGIVDGDRLGLGCDRAIEELALGRLTLMPAICAVAVRMNMTSTTISTSTSGVMLMPSTGASSSSSWAADTEAMGSPYASAAAGASRTEGGRQRGAGWWAASCSCVSPCTSARRVTNSSTNTRISALTSLLRETRRL